MWGFGTGNAQEWRLGRPGGCRWQWQLLLGYGWSAQGVGQFARICWDWWGRSRLGSATKRVLPLRPMFFAPPIFRGTRPPRTMSISISLLAVGRTCGGEFVPKTVPHFRHNDLRFCVAHTTARQVHCPHWRAGCERSGPFHFLF